MCVYVYMKHVYILVDYAQYVLQVCLSVRAVDWILARCLLCALGCPVSAKVH